MKKECNGFFGKIFGHKIKALLIKYEPQPMGRVETSSLVEVVEANANKEYKIICTRCGEPA